MWFMIKGTFWFSMVLIALPLLDPESSERLENAPPVRLSESISAAMEAFEDIKAICERKPDVCETGSQTFEALGLRAREGARIAYQYLDGSFGSSDDTALAGTQADGSVFTGSVPTPTPAALTRTAD